jgi:hypothetical protein
MKNAKCLIALLLVFFFSLSTLQAQLPVIWKGQTQTTIEELWFPDGPNTTPQAWSLRDIYHDQTGRDTSARLQSEEGSIQKVRYSYNDKGHLISRYHDFGSDSIMEFTWTYEYDDKGDLTSALAFDENKKLISQQIMRYDDRGILVEKAGYFKNSIYNMWRTLEEEDGLLKESPELIRIGSRYMKFDWTGQRFLERRAILSFAPNQDHFMRYSYKVSKRNQLLSSVGHGRLGDTLSTVNYKYDTLARMRSALETNRIDSATRAWDFVYEGSQTKPYKVRYLNVTTNDTRPILNVDIDMEADVLKERRIKKEGALTDHYIFNGGKLDAREKRDIFGNLLERLEYDEWGRIQESTRFDENGNPSLLRRYTYK